MASVKAFCTRNKIPIACLLLFFLTAGLRFPNLGYSDYHGDEFKAFMSPKSFSATWQFLMEQRKGPIQFLVSGIPYLFTRDFTNEFAQRLPFAASSCLATVAFFLFVYKYTQNCIASFMAGILLLTNGFIAGFGRIAQYQNLNLLFSSSALLAYAYFSDTEISQKKKISYSLLGTAVWCLSILSHWDGVLIAPIVFFITWRTFLRNKHLLIFNIFIGLLLLLPFVVPYINNLKEDARNQKYLSARVGIDAGYSKIPLYKSLTEIYNPYLVLPFLCISAAVALIGLRKNYPLIVWFFVVFGLFELFAKNPGTHIYNFLLPIFILSGLGMAHILRVNKYSNYLITPVILVALVFMYLQTYMLFVDHNKEYPYETKNINFLGRSFVAHKITAIKPGYMRGSYIPLFGYPHNRFWKEINEFINEENVKNNDKLKFITNEDKAFCDNYMDTQYGMGNKYYAVGIKRPTNFVEDFNFTTVGSKELVHQMKLHDEVVVKIFKVTSKKSN
jgi:hypothetical protein